MLLSTNKILVFAFCLPMVSGNANNSGKAGSFTLNANNTWSNRNANIGTHLRLIMKLKKAKTIPLGKTQSKTSFSLVNN